MRKLAAALVVAAAFGSVTCAMAQQSEQYIVILKEAPRIMLFDEDDGVIDHYRNIFVVDSMQAALSLAPASSVKAIFPDETAYLFDDEAAALSEDAPVIEPYPNGADDIYYADQWHIPYIGATTAWSKGLDGSGVRIAVIDSGMDLYHDDLPKPKYYCNTISGADSTNVQDSLGHGTAVTGIIAAKTNNSLSTSGIAHGAEIVSIKVTSSKTMSISSLVKGFTMAIEEYGCDVINMSLGFTSASAPSSVEPMRELVAEAIEDGVIIVAAAGNEGATANGSRYQYPASYEDVVSVGSLGNYSNLTGVDMDFTKYKVPNRNDDGTYSYSTILADVPSSFTQYNDQLTCAAPGYRIMSTSLDNSVLKRNGTSFSAPIVASAAAIAKQIDPGITAPEFIEALKATCDDVFTNGYDIYTGYGKLNMERLIAYLSDKPTPTASAKPSPTPTPTPAPVSTITKSGSMYTIQAVHDEIDESARVFAAIYEGDTLKAIKSVPVSEGSMETKLYFNYEGEIDYADIFIWAVDENGNPSMVSLADKFVIKREAVA